MGQKEIKSFEVNENEDITYQNLGDAPKPVLRWKFMPVNSYVKKEERSQINSLSLKHLKKKSRLNLKQAKGKK